MVSGPSHEFLLPPLSELLPPESTENPSEAQSFWSPFDNSTSPDHGYIRYERASSTNETPDASEETPKAMGLGITRTLTGRSNYQQPPEDLDEGDLATKPLTPDRDSYVPSLATNHHSQTELLSPPPQYVKCPTYAGIMQRRLSWVPMTMMVLAIYSTIFSGIYLVMAVWKPRYGRLIGEEGPLSPSTASLLSAAIAKTIELSYVTVCVAFLGQVLSRRAITKGSRGITIADMSMRTWIMQPGSLIVHWETLRYSALTILGMITLTATLVAMLYTTAAEALVSPKLLMGHLEPRILWGNVSTQFANPDWVSARCPTPITNITDPQYYGTTCLEIEHVGQAYHNYQAYITAWSQLVHSDQSAAPDLGSRLPPSGSLYDNTTVFGSWIDQVNMTQLSAKYGRMVNNVTAAMPHTNVLAAASNPVNGIRQPRDLSGEGTFDLEASVPSPAVNVLCVGMTAQELSPLIYNMWPGTQDEFNETTWLVDQPADIPRWPDWLNRTVVDDIFGFGQEYGQRPPIFGKLPEPYNTITNTTGYWPTNAIYILGAAPDPTMTPPYVLCALKAKQSPVCSTKYSAAASGGNFATNCENPSNPLQYNRRNPDAVDGLWSPDWKNIASEWSNALSLGSGITDGDASNARLLTEFIPTLDNNTDTYFLSPKLPSVSEALAVMAGCTLLLSSQDAPFVPYWNYTTPNLTEPALQQFNATLRAVGYESAGMQQWQGLFYVILVFAFITNAIMLAFMLFEVRGRQVTDFTEPQNLFSLAMNSPGTSQLHGACGAGPHGRQLNERFYVAMEEEDEHYYIRTKAEEHLPPAFGPKQSMGSLEVEEPGKAVSPAMHEYRRVSARSSLLSRFY